MGKGEGQERGESRPWRSSRRTLVCPPVLLASGAARQRLSPSLAQEAGVGSEQGARTPTGRPAVGPGPLLDVTSDEMSKVQMRGVLTGFPKAGGEARSVAPPDPTFSCTFTRALSRTGEPPAPVTPGTRSPFAGPHGALTRSPLIAWATRAPSWVCRPVSSQALAACTPTPHCSSCPLRQGRCL